MQERKESATKLTLRKREIRELTDEQLRHIVGCGHVSDFCSNATCTDACSGYDTRIPP